ncbi:PREDICTED: uncharacterized protein LOC106817880 [Priapulus caudatus]|uniref:Uncharacterized protein LOC106817880 n=1 Tax=Priapulus caudatus TaxID=37621 RepID=A0ABM1F0V5_PRICU|nr:PREDICTED: uncharacterized protein LOC106817880 [Priapulus caudatus]
MAENDDFVDLENDDLEVCEGVVLPYEYEPMLNCVVGDIDGGVSRLTDDGDEPALPPLDEWCSCGHCALMATMKENVCCRQSSNFRKKIETMGHKCITEHPGFQSNCLDIYVLEATYYEFRAYYPHRAVGFNRVTLISIIWNII